MPKSNTKIYSEKETKTEIQPDGTEHVSIVEKTGKIENSTEPDYIKIYTKMWCEFNQIPERYRPLFLELATRMSYANASEPDGSQIVYTGEPVASAICKALGWKQKDSLMKGLKALCNCEAIQKVNRAVYRINPGYAGKGEWKYRPSLDRGGVEDLIATFSFKDKKVHTQIVWANTPDANSDIDDAIRDSLDITPGDEASIKFATVTPTCATTGDGDALASPTDTKDTKNRGGRRKKKEDTSNDKS